MSLNVFLTISLLIHRHFPCQVAGPRWSRNLVTSASIRFPYSHILWNICMIAHTHWKYESVIMSNICLTCLIYVSTTCIWEISVANVHCIVPPLFWSNISRNLHRTRDDRNPSHWVLLVKYGWVELGWVLFCHPCKGRIRISFFPFPSSRDRNVSTVSFDELLFYPGVNLELVPVGGDYPGEGVSGDHKGGRVLELSKVGQSTCPRSESGTSERGDQIHIETLLSAINQKRSLGYAPTTI